MRALVVADSVTALPPHAAGAVVVAGSHGGVYAAYLAARARAAAVVLNDAGVGRDDAGIGGLAYLDALRVPAATVAHDSARIGDGADTLARGGVSHVNAAARALGVARGQSATAAVATLCARAPRAAYVVPPLREGRVRLAGPWDDRIAAWALDSISLLDAHDAGAIVIVGSHGGLLGGRAATALSIDAAALVCNDAGGGRDDAGYARLPALDARGVPAATVAAHSARIGEGLSTYEDGIVSRVNRAAARIGLEAGMHARDAVARLARAISNP